MKKQTKVLLGICAVAVLALLLGLYSQLQSARQQNHVLSSQLQRMQGDMADLQHQVETLSALKAAPTPRPTASALAFANPVVQSTPTILTPDEQTISNTVYITKTGKKYHRVGCQYLKQSSIPIQLDQAIAAGYGPCSRCKP